jgi:hypothetical protein
MPDGRQQEPGGWNRVLLQVQDSIFSSKNEPGAGAKRSAARPPFLVLETNTKP